MKEWLVGTIFEKGENILSSFGHENQSYNFLIRKEFDHITLTRLLIPKSIYFHHLDFKIYQNILVVFYPGSLKDQAMWWKKHPIAGGMKSKLDF